MDRRHLLGLLVAGGWTAPGLPVRWAAPVVDSVLVPAHAQSSPAALASAAGPTYEGPLPVARGAAYTLSGSSDHEMPAPGLFADSGFGPDNLGNPAATLVYFGGGSAGGTVSSNLAGSAVELAGGTLRVGEDGSWSLAGQPFTPGTYTFRYRITNVNGSSDATVTLEIRDATRPPVAGDDFITVASDTPSSGSLISPNGGDPDALGEPPATLASFGGGSLGGSVTDNAPGATVELAGGMLMVDAEGTWSLTDTPFSAGTYTFRYRLRNAAGTSDATVTMQVEDVSQPPLAADDRFSVIAGNTLTGNVLADNGSGADKRGNPAARVLSFGGASSGSSVTDNKAGATVPLANGRLTLRENGALEFTGAAAEPGTYTFEYRLGNELGTSDATVTIRIARRVS